MAKKLAIGRRICTLWSTIRTMRVLVSMLVALLGAVAGTAIGVALTYALLSGQEADAFVWLAAGVFFCFPGMLGGAVVAGLLFRRLFPEVFQSSRVETTRRGRYGIGASLVYGIGGSVLMVCLVAVAGWLATGYFAGDDTSYPSLTGKLCKKTGVLYDGTTAQGVRVCFTLTPDRSKWVEIGWRFSSASGCAGGSQPGWAGATSYDYGSTLASPGQITEPDFTATIRGARASGVLKDPDVCPGKKFNWNAREVSSSTP